MNENDNVVLLLDIYGELLPKSQQTALDLRYNSDLSLGEIAEEMGGISRQSVNDFLKKGKIRLTEFESVLGNAARFRKISAELDTMKTELDSIHPSDRYKESRAELVRSMNRIRKAINE